MIENFPKTYNPGLTENKWYEVWQKNKIYSANNKSEKLPYSILMPPPNVTGILHFGHVLNHTIQDIFIRWKRMQGYEVCWFPGTDHAGIATQSKVEQELKKQNLNRYMLGREKFLEKVWEWREKYGGIIIQQLKLLGISCDWERTLFTLDESASNAVREVFIRLFDEGLIYRGKRIINWSPLAQTALSDEEVDFREVKEHLYTLKYYFVDSDEYLTIATARPETIFGDTAIAVNPNDERFQKHIGKKVWVPLVNRIIEVIADEYADPSFGTGCVKITPAHDPNDFLVGERHNLEIINSINPDGTLNEITGEFNGIDRFKARKMIVNKLKELDLIEKIEDYSHKVGFSQRGGEAIEPYLSDQWFVRMKPLAEIALKPVIEGAINFYPNHWVKTYENWLNNIKDWCISRQLWWGHRIPVYYTDDGKYTAARNPQEAIEKLNLPKGTNLKQDEDVLDTWFSSWLWPLTTMRWLYDSKTEETDDLKFFLPTNLLVTAPDIIFFWVARMIMATMKFKNEIPFKDVYFTSTIRDEQGRKLSKSLGNSPDPINIIEKYGADACRFTIIYLSPLGQDVRMTVDVEHQDIPSMEIGRNFANKVWNAGRFLVMNRDMAFLPDVCPPNKGANLEYSELSISDRWLLSRLNSTIKNVNYALDNYKVNDYSKILYDFIWRDFCDWYIEIVKVQLNNTSDLVYKQKLTKFTIEIYDTILKLLHPVMPFLTEEIYHLTNIRDENKSISLESIPDHDESMINPKLEVEFSLIQSIVEEIRSLRASLEIAPKHKIPVLISCNNKELVDFFARERDIIETLGKCSKVDVSLNGKKPKNSLSSVVRGIEIFLMLEGAIDIEKEKNRLQKDVERISRNIENSEKKLSNENFVNKAPENIIMAERQKLENMKESLKKVLSNLENLE